MTVTEVPVRGIYLDGKWYQLTEQIPSEDENWCQATTNAFVKCTVGTCTFLAGGSASLEEHQLRTHTFAELIQQWKKK